MVFEKDILTTRLHCQVRKFVIRREVQPKGEGKKPYTKAPRIQRLVTPQRLQHKRHRMALKRRQAESSKDAAVCLSLHNLHLHPLGQSFSKGAWLTKRLPERVRLHPCQARQRRKSKEDGAEE